MSRRDSDSRHHRSRSDREPSPKRAKRDGKTATEQPTSNLNSTERIDRDKKHHRRLQDSVPLGSAVVTGSKTDSVSLSKESDKKSNGYREGTKISSDNIEAPRSRSHLQHDERAGQVGRSFRHKETTERDWWKDKKPKDEKTRSDGLYKVEPDSKQISKKRPSFRETKLPVNESATQVTKTPVNAEGRERKEERGKPLEKPPVDHLPDRRLSGGRDPHRNESQRMKFQSRVRYGGGGAGGGFGGSFRGRDRFNERQSGGRVNKWKHDLYDEANKSPTTKNEEDQIAKVEALLAS
ncbi:hypothetical protein L1987_49224 [Smallanthus sonchifolius]|uniref:Uncharacterized protein n=1 Tax=Smallanthus sonchifolius TaxID=185202 RepID=A0ACB9FV39_9ASTR|nr:hypothetical protein L1987_49224 [Smallanthus sonchifolius]